MATSITFTTTAYGGSVPASGTTTVIITGEASLSAAPTIPAAKEATLTTRTNDTSGVLTMTTGHGYTTGSRCDLYWTNADGTEGNCYGVVLGTVPAAPGDTAVPIASVAGDDPLPLDETDVVICKCVEVPLAFLGNNARAIVAQAPQARSYFVMNDGTYNLNPQHVSEGGMYYWHEELAVTNPLADDSLTRVFISHDDTNQAITNSIVSVITED
jgi:hypothetical protein